MKKYFLLIFGEMSNSLSYSLLQGISHVCESPFLKFKFTEDHFLMHFSSSLEKEELEIIIDELTLEDVDSYFLVENNDKTTVKMLNEESKKFLDLESEPSDLSKLEKSIDDNQNDKNNVEFFVNYLNELGDTEYYDDEDDEEIETILKKSHKETLSLDDILDKINLTGINSLTDTEKNYLKKLAN